MPNCCAVWEDEENNRRIDLAVEYELQQGQVQVIDVTPSRVSFLEGPCGRVERELGVHTPGGRALLARQAEAAGRFTNLHREIAEGLKVERPHADTAPVEDSPTIRV